MKDKEHHKKEKDTVDYTQQWIELVHGGTCCAFNDPMREKKEAFISEIRKESKK